MDKGLGYLAGSSQIKDVSHGFAHSGTVLDKPPSDPDKVPDKVLDKPEHLLYYIQ